MHVNNTLVKCAVVALFVVEICGDFEKDNERNNSLRLVHVLFRHGDRYPDTYCKQYSVNKTDNYWPDGFGALTMKGKMQQYLIGVDLRKRYGHWLGNTFAPEVQTARTTDYERTKTSLQLVLAGLWPPTVSQTWNWEINWQPIPFDYVRKGEDYVMGLPSLCPQYVKLWKQIKETDDYKRIVEKEKPIIDYVLKMSNTTKLPYLLPTDYLYSVYFCFYAMKATGRSIPIWGEQIFPDILQKAAILKYQLMLYSEEIRKLTGGPILKTIIDHSLNRINGVLTKKKKLFLYSGHEFNVAALLGVMNLFIPHVPVYSSYVILELHEINNVYGFKVFYQDYKNVDPRPLKVPGCDYFCPLHQFTDMLQNNLPTTDDFCQ